MGIRISWRSRPRNGEYPWLLRTESVTNAGIDYGPDGMTRLIGPLTLEAVVELLYRVEEIQYDGSIAIDIGGYGSFDESFNGTLIPSFEEAPITVSEITKFERYFPQNPDPDNINLEYRDHDSNQPKWVRPITSSTFERNDLPFSEIYKDDNGNFYLNGGFDFTATADVGGTPFTYFISSYGNFSLDYVQVFDADLILFAGTFPIKVGVPYSIGDTFVASHLTLTASKWHPFATTTGSDAWNTTTGAPANGGPGA